MPANVTYQYSSNINSFPTTKMESVNKLITENSLTRLINRLLDVDSFVITDGLVEANTGSIGNGGVHLKINNNLKMNDIDFQNDLFEFVIRGYYFSAPVDWLKNIINTYIGNYSGDSSVGLYARIFIDNTNPSYPELIGQTAYEDGAPGTTQGNHYGVQFFACPINDKPTPYHPSVTIDPVTGTIVGLGTNILYFDLMLMEYIKGDPTMAQALYLPFESLNKFDSHSVNIIDGGVLDLV